LCRSSEKSGDNPHIKTPTKVSRNFGGSRNYSQKWPKTPGRLLGTGLIRLYQLTLSSIVGSSCRHQPSCSEYGYEAIARHGLLAGSWLTFFRVAKCNPWGTSGYDPVPNKMRWVKTRPAKGGENNL
jgi:putative membrane protein insertion efficiency factor